MKKINYKSLPEKTADVISDMIYQQNYLSGTKLPNEIDLAQELEVSRNTVREAIHILVRKNILDVRRGSGTYVTARTGLTDDLLGLSLIVDKNKLAIDLLEIRMMIEPKIAGLAAEYASTAEIASLIENCNRLDQTIKADEKYYELDMEFHTLVARCSKNLVIHHMIPSINQNILIQENITSKRRKNQTLEYHWKICKAIEAHHSNEAHHAMFAHLLLIREALN